MNSTGREGHQRITLTVISCHDTFQQSARQRGSLTAEYQQRSAIMQMSPQDMHSLGIEDKAVVKLTSSAGSVTVQAKSDPRCEPGFGYIPMSLYSNRLSSYDPLKAKLPNFKNMEVMVEPSDESITPIQDIWNDIKIARR